MNNNKTVFFWTLFAAALSLAVLIANWNTAQKWRFVSAAIGFVILFVICCGSAYVTFFRSSKK